MCVCRRKSFRSLVQFQPESQTCWRWEARGLPCTELWSRTIGHNKANPAVALALPGSGQHQGLPAFTRCSLPRGRDGDPRPFSEAQWQRRDRASGQRESRPAHPAIPLLGGTSGGASLLHCAGDTEALGAGLGCLPLHAHPPTPHVILLGDPHSQLHPCSHHTPSCFLASQP